MGEMVKNRVHVAVGVITNQSIQGNAQKSTQVLLTQRPSDAHQGGCWEFPGGKVEEGESAILALQRELQEEVGIRILAQVPLLSVTYDYPDKPVLLDVWQVTEFAGEPQPQEGQPMCWVDVTALANYSFPAANVAIVNQLLAMFAEE